MDNANTTAKTNRFEYRTPVGTFRTWDEAADAVEMVDMDPCDCIEIAVAAPAPAGPFYSFGPGGSLRLGF